MSLPPRSAGCIAWAGDASGTASQRSGEAKEYGHVDHLVEARDRREVLGVSPQPRPPLSRRVDRGSPPARPLARQFRKGSEPFDEPVQVASIGLINAVERY